MFKFAKLLFSIAALLILAGCSSASESVTQTTPKTAVSDAATFVSLNPTATEILFAIESGDQVLAADAYSDYPTQAPSDEALDAFNPSLERILEYQPTHVVLGVANPEVSEALENNGITVLVQPTPASLVEVYQNINELSLAADKVAQGDSLVEGIQSKVASVAKALKDIQGQTIYHEVASGESNQGYYTSYEETFIGDIYQQLGLTNIANAADLDQGLIDPETVLAEDPEIVIVNSASGFGAPNADIVAGLIERPGWADMAAVRANAVYVADSDLASRGGPRLVEYLEFLEGNLS